MKLQQLRYLVEVENQGLSVSDAADALHTSQPGVSKQIKLLEEELGLIVFERSAKRFTGVSEPGKRVIEISRRILRETENLKRVADDYAGGEGGQLTIAATHTQARYALPAVVKAFIERFPKVRLILHQGSPTQIAEWLIAGEADLAIATEALDRYPEIVALPCRQWSHCVVAPDGHPVLGKTLSLAEIARYPLITYDTAFAGRSKINAAFEQAGLSPNVVLTAVDSDVIKTYVGLGLGLGIIADMAFDPARDGGLVACDAGHLFAANVTKIGLRRGTHLRQMEYALMEGFAPALTRKVVDRAMAGEGHDYSL